MRKSKFKISNNIREKPKLVVSLMRNTRKTSYLIPSLDPQYNVNFPATLYDGNNDFKNQSRSNERQ